MFHKLIQPVSTYSHKDNQLVISEVLYAGCHLTVHTCISLL